MPRDLIVARYFADDKAAIADLEAELESLSARRSELETKSDFIGTHIAVRGNA